MVKIEPPGASLTAALDLSSTTPPHPERSLSFWYYNTSKRGITLDLETADGGDLFRRLTAATDVILETFCRFLRRWGSTMTLSQREPAADHMCADPLRPDRSMEGLPLQRPVAHGGGRRTASSGYDEADVAKMGRRSRQAAATPGTWAVILPIWPLWRHSSSDVLKARSVYRRIDPRGLRADHRGGDRELRLPGEVLRRQTGRHHAPGSTPRTQFRAKDGTYVCALVAGRLNPKYIASWPICSTPTAWPAILGTPNTRTLQ